MFDILPSNSVPNKNRTVVIDDQFFFLGNLNSGFSHQDRQQIISSNKSSFFCLTGFKSDYKKNVFSKSIFISVFE